MARTVKLTIVQDNEQGLSVGVHVGEDVPQAGVYASIIFRDRAGWFPEPGIVWGLSHSVIQSIPGGPSIASGLLTELSYQLAQLTRNKVLYEDAACALQALPFAEVVKRAVYVATNTEGPVIVWREYREGFGSVYQARIPQPPPPGAVVLGEIQPDKVEQ